MMTCIWRTGLFNLDIGDPECKDLNITTYAAKIVETCPTVSFYVLF